MSSKHHKVIFFLWVFSLSLGATCMIAWGGEKAANKTAQNEIDFFHDKSVFEDEWVNFELEQHNAWLRMKNEIEQKWQKLILSDRRTWVAYDKALDTRSRVDFKTGLILVETIEPISGTVSLDAIKSRIADQIRRIFNKKQITGESILDGQVENDRGEKVTAQTIDRYISEVALAGIQKDNDPFRSQDGQMRTKYSIGIKLVPDHLRVRALRFYPIVNTNAAKYGIDPALVMAVIHTESYFNPLAVSKAGAVGLMQVIPRYGGREAYQYIHGEDWTIGPDYLYAPGINIELGTAYLYLLQTRYFGDVNDPVKRRNLAICAYNWGPTAVKRKILSKYNPNKLDRKGLYNVLSQQTPRETQQYLTRVNKRIAFYRGDS